jgi:hypothetical protein
LLRHQGAKLVVGGLASATTVELNEPILPGPANGGLAAALRAAVEGDAFGHLYPCPIAWVSGPPAERWRAALPLASTPRDDATWQGT